MGAVLDDARRQADAIIARARQQAAATLEQATAEIEQAGQERLKVAQVEAARKTEAIQASVSVAAGRLRAARVESILQSVYDAARGRLVARQGYDYTETLVALVTEAARHMGNAGLVVRLSPADRAAVAEQLGQFTLVEDPSLTDGGAVVLDADGRRVWDNRLIARLDRLWPELRRQIVVQGSLQ
jgi:vacuolar-type H+-ATPase subunit E/Vma4